jgi:hypothetical protein
MCYVVKVSIIHLSIWVVEAMQVCELLRPTNVRGLVLINVITLHFLGIVPIKVTLESIVLTNAIPRFIIRGLVHTPNELSGALILIVMFGGLGLICFGSEILRVI